MGCNLEEHNQGRVFGAPLALQGKPQCDNLHPMPKKKAPNECSPAAPAAKNRDRPSNRAGSIQKKKEKQKHPGIHSLLHSDITINIAEALFRLFNKPIGAFGPSSRPLFITGLKQRQGLDNWKRRVRAAQGKEGAWEKRTAGGIG